MELQSALLLIGLVIIGVVGLSAYDTARVRNRLAKLKRKTPAADARDAATGRAPSSTPPPAADAGRDVKLTPPAQHKVLSSEAATPVTTSSPDESAFYQALADLEDVAVMPLGLGIDMPSAVEPLVQSMPDLKLDFVINLPGAQPVARDKALAVYKQNEYLLDKPRQIYGLRHGAGLWTNLERDPATAHYSDIAIALQLLDTKGPVTETELNTFSQLGLKLADALHRPTRLSMTFEQAIERAQELNQFCETYDVFASINLVPVGNQGFPGRMVERAATRVGMEFGSMNIFHMKNRQSLGARHLFSLANLYHPGQFNLQNLDTTIIQGVTLFMSVPAVHQPVQVFTKMTDTARQLCEFLGAKMLDHDKRPLTTQSLAAIGAQIEALANDMKGQGIVPGSAGALRLFFSND